MVVLVCVPTFEEFSELRPGVHELVSVDGIPVVWETWGTVRVVLGITGVGTARSAAVAAALMEMVRPDTAWLLGTAGALDPDLEIGDVIACRRVGRVGCEDLGLGVPVPGWSDEVREGVAVTVDRAVTTAHERQRLRRMGYGVVEMEGYEVALAARAAGVSFAMVRAVSDCPGLTCWEEGIAPAMQRLEQLFARLCCSRLEPAH